MPALSTDSHQVCLSVANLQLMLDAQRSGIHMALPKAHARFAAEALRPGLTLSVREGPLRQASSWRAVYGCPLTWRLWQDEWGRYVFQARQHRAPARQVTVDPCFSSGEVLCQFDGEPELRGPIYPLEGIDTMLMANWLADCGDLILHACGVEANGRGYCFAGASGAGKSTLASAFAQASSLTLLGEDNLVLRCLEGRFWIFGTPFHLDAARCSPRGAPLAKVFFLDRAAEHGIGECSACDGVARLLQTAFVPYYRPSAVARIVDNLACLAEQVPFHTLGYRLGSDVLSLVQHG